MRRRFDRKSGAEAPHSIWAMPIRIRIESIFVSERLRKFEAGRQVGASGLRGRREGRRVLRRGLGRGGRTWTRSAQS